MKKCFNLFDKKPKILRDVTCARRKNNMTGGDLPTQQIERHLPEAHVVARGQGMRTRQKTIFYRFYAVL